MEEMTDSRRMFRAVCENLGLPTECPHPVDQPRTRNPLAAWAPFNWSNATSHLLRGGVVTLDGTGETHESYARVNPEMAVHGPEEALTLRCENAVDQLAAWTAEDPFSDGMTAGDALLAVWAVVEQFYDKGEMTERAVAEREAAERGLVEVTPRSLHEAVLWEDLGWDVVLASDPDDASTWTTLQVKNTLQDSADREKAVKEADELIVEG